MGRLSEGDRVVHTPSGKTGELHLLSADEGWVYVEYDDDNYGLVRLSELLPAPKPGGEEEG